MTLCRWAWAFKYVDPHRVRPECTDRKCDILLEACTWVEMMLVQCMQMLSHLLTAGRERKADATGVAIMVKIKEQLNSVGNRSVPAACSQST